MAGVRRPLYGVGINDADYDIYKYEYVNGKRVFAFRCPYYDRWAGLLQRCYSSKWHMKQPSYKDCEICDEWRVFSNFKAWMEKQDWEGKHLDKDLLVEGNKVYGPETCVFLPRVINNFIAGRIDNGGYKRGVFKRGLKFTVTITDPTGVEKRHVGTFDTEIEAHLAWKAAKHRIALRLIKSQQLKDTRVIEALKNRFHHVDR